MLTFFHRMQYMGQSSIPSCEMGYLQNQRDFQELDFFVEEDARFIICLLL